MVVKSGAVAGNLPSSGGMGFAGLEEFRAFKSRQELTVAELDRLSVEAASSFINHYFSTGGYLDEAITLLCEIATLEEEDLAKPGLKGIFPLIVERLSDSFDPECCSLYDRAFVQVVEFCRHLPIGKVLDQKLKHFGLINGQDLLERKNRIKDRKGKFDPTLQSIVKKVFILSRVTLGADVAITSLFMAKMKRAFTNAELVLLGSPRMKQLFGGDPRVRICEVPYERNGGLIDRLESWLELVEVLDQEKKGLSPEEYLVVDSDSRFTQLGLLPLVDDESRYYFFESRGYRKSGIGCISQLALSWLNERFHDEEELYPYVCLNDEDRNFAKQFCRKLCNPNTVYLVGINFGVGNNNRKRVPDPFEEQLVRRLLDEGNLVILDKGCGAEEISRADRLTDHLKAQGKAVLEINESNASKVLQEETSPVDMVVWEGGIGLFSALIAETNEYIGYDSAGQHIAAALGIPTIDIFADSSHPLFFERWRPYGKEIVEVVKADAADRTLEQADLDQILDEVMAYHRKIRESQP